jgi:molybdate transport system ATP-binding protein
MLTARVYKEFAGGFTLDVDFAAPPGVTILFGASGSGKTLTLKSIAGLERPDRGIVSVGGETLFDSARGLSLPVRLRRVGYVFQNLALFPHLTARENVEFAVTHLPARERRARALALLEQFGVAHTAERLPRAVSGGEAQRVALARALAGEPRLLLLDEPLSALDEPVKLGIINDLKALNRDLRLPVLYVTHSREEAVSLGERALIYERGRVVAAGEPLEVFGAPVTASVARLTGVENIFEGVVEGTDEAAGTMRVRVGEGACVLEVPLGRQAAGARVSVAVRSGDIMLATAEPRGLSARNLLAGRVAGVEPRAEQTLVRVAAGVSWVAGVTRQSLQELQLEAGRPVWLAFKTYAVRVFDAE